MRIGSGLSINWTSNNGSRTTALLPHAASGFRTTLLEGAVGSTPSGSLAPYRVPSLYIRLAQRMGAIDGIILLLYSPTSLRNVASSSIQASMSALNSAQAAGSSSAALSQRPIRLLAKSKSRMAASL